VISDTPSVRHADKETRRQLVLKSPLSVVVATLAAGALLAACSSPGSGGGGSQTSQSGQASSGLSKDATLAAELPADIKASGVIRVAADETYPPFESISGGKLAGLDVDLANAMGTLLGVRIQLVNTTFDAIIPALVAEKVDMAMSSIGDTKTRQQAVDFATYFHNSGAVLVKMGNPLHVRADLTCGVHVGAVRGTLEQNTFLPQQAVKCRQAGKPAPIVAAFQTSPEALLALQSGRIDAYMDDIPPLSLIVQEQPAMFEVAGPITRVPDPGGIAFPKGSALVQSVHDALNVLMRNGTYMKIMKKWNLTEIAISRSEINGATS
jgi:polar amino acid transport system substrate-binding protein